MSVTRKTRWESYEKINQRSLHELIFSLLLNSGEYGMTAREVSVALYKDGLLKENGRQATAPRLTELVEANRISVIGKRFDEVSMRNVAVYGVRR